jgi:3alpha(or 20beta)-hydroxysteroid dehydrogenase
MARLEGKVALITGAAGGGMGTEHVRLFVEEGAKVIFTDIQQKEDAGRALAAEFGPDTLFLVQDVADSRQWASVTAAGAAHFGPITVLVNNAGYPGPTALTSELDDETYLRVVDVNQNGVFFGMRAVLAGMVEAGGGSIVNISSAAGMAHMKGSQNAAYTASKTAVRGLTKATAIEYARQGIRVNSVHPGAIKTPQAERMSKEYLDSIAEILPIGRFADPREIAYAVLFLASDESSYMTGSELVIDGGRLAE